GLALSLAGVLHAQGAAIVNPYPVSLALRDKIVMSRILQAAGVSTPATYVTTHPDKLAPLLEAGPLIVKPYQGTGGYGIRIIRSAVELAEVPHGKEPVFAQRYHPPQGPDRKMSSIGGRIFGVKKVFPRRTDAEKDGEPFTPTPELCEIARRAAGCRVIWLEGVDLNDRANSRRRRRYGTDVRECIATLKERLEPYGFADAIAFFPLNDKPLPRDLVEGCLDLDAAAEADLL